MEKALEINEEIGFRKGEASNLFSLGKYYESKKDHENALKCYNKSKRINYEIGVVYQFSKLTKRIKRLNKLLHK